MLLYQMQKQRLKKNRTELNSKATPLSTVILPTAIPSELFTEVSCLPKTKTKTP